jgi:hypothetical protein
MNHVGDMLSLGMSAACIERRITLETYCLLGCQQRALNGESRWRHAVSKHYIISYINSDISDGLYLEFVTVCC